MSCLVLQPASSFMGAKSAAVFGRCGVQLPAKRPSQGIGGTQAAGDGDARQRLIRRLKAVARHLHAHGLYVRGRRGAQLGLEQAGQLSLADVDSFGQERQREGPSNVLRYVVA